MNLYVYVAHGLQLKGKYGLYITILYLVLLLVEPGVGRPSDGTVGDFDVGEEYGDVDNLELHYVKIVNGTPFEDYKVIMYKEDFVNEDYKPSKNGTITIPKNGLSEDSIVKSSRKYKDVEHRQRDHSQSQPINALKPEKLYFDILPQSPLIGDDDLDKNNSKFDPSKIHVDVISLIDMDNASKNTEGSGNLKEVLFKRPKKYHRRIRRSQDNHHTIQKRNPYYYQGSQINDVANYFKRFHSTIRQSLFPYPINNKYIVPGKFWNGINYPVPELDNDNSVTIKNRGQENEYERDRIVWGSSRKTTSRASPNRIPMPSRRPAPPLFHDSDPEHADWSFLTTRPLLNDQRSTTTVQSEILSSSQPKMEYNNSIITKCVWAIVNCCSNRDYNVRYNCFEQLGCSGAFWGLNPCADNIKDNVVSYINTVYD